MRGQEVSERGKLSISMRGKERTPPAAYVRPGSFVDVGASDYTDTLGSLITE